LGGRLLLYEIEGIGVYVDKYNLYHDS